VSLTVKVNGTVNSVVHKGSNHVSAATMPDVCKTPSPGGPVPIPYPNVSRSSSLSDGTTTVKADGGNMIANKGSQFSMSNGDEAGTVGGVKSSTFTKESTWILYSFDVKLEGKGACRLSDKKFQNHENTADMMGAAGGTVSVEDMVKCAIQECDKESYDVSSESDPEERCKLLGTKKHTCVSEKLKGNEPKLYTEASFDMKCDSPEMIMSQTRPGEPSHFFSAVNKMRKWYPKGKGKYKPGQGDLRRPDVCTGKGPDCDVFDAKFPCPDSVRNGKRKSGVLPSKREASVMSDDQRNAYQDIAGDGKVTSLSPMECEDAEC
jgi:hypothetical protein